MNHVTGVPRLQLQMSSLEDSIDKENPVRFVDAFVEQLDLSKLGFEVKTLKKEGRPSFESSTLLKIYLYGYLNGLRSSRRLESECCRNIELQWLTLGLRPNYHTIADFRKDNPKALKSVFKLFVSFLKDIDLIGGNVIAIDGTKSRAHNSKKNNYNQKKIDRHLAYIEEKSTEYMNLLEQNDIQEDLIKVSDIQAKIERLKKNKIKYEVLQEKLESSGEPQISTTDPDARALLVQGQVVEVCYNIQAAVDDKHKLVIATHTINRNDRNALTDIALEAKENLNAESFVAVLDKGYHNGREIQQCQDANIVTIVAPSIIVNSNTHGTTPEYVVTNFTYNTEDDSYTCPQGKTLNTTGTWHKKSRDKNISYQFKKYRTPECKTCPVKHLCTGRASGGREIERSEYAAAVEANNTRYKENAVLYRKRQEINEHIFGTIKRKWGFYYTNLKGLEKVNGEHSLIMLVYNLKRCFTILGVPELTEKLKNWVSPYKKEPSFLLNWLYLKLLEGIFFIRLILHNKKCYAYNS
jgi:radical SAM protein with 4Fe4S-binding SPASM domain